MSNAVVVRIVRICAWVRVGFADFNKAAIAAACGAAAEVPKKARSSPVFMVVETPSAAVMSGLARTCPPFAPNVRLPGVIGEPSALKKTRLGPSDEKFSTLSAAENALGNGPIGYPGVKGSPAGVAPTLKTPMLPAAE